MKNWLHFLFFVSLVALTWLIFIFLLVTFTSPNGAAAFENAYGALFGALFGVLLGQIIAFANRFSETERAHYSSLVKTDYQCNLLHNQFSDSLMLIDNFLEVSRKPLPIWGNRFVRIPLISDTYPNVKSLQLINEILGFDVRVRKYNTDCDMFNKNIDDLQAMMGNKKITREEYVENIRILASKANTLRDYVHQMQEQLKRIHAIVRKRLEDRPFFNFAYRLVQRSYNKSLPPHVIEAEVEVLEQEMERTRKRSTAFSSPS